MRYAKRLALFIGTTLLVPSSAFAQVFGIGIGVTSGRGGTFVDRSALAGSLSIQKVGDLQNGAIVVGRAAAHVAMHNGSSLRCIPVSANACAPSEPDLLAFGASGGVGYRYKRATVSALVGPSTAVLSQDGSSDSRIGFTISAVSTVRISRRVSAMASYDRIATRFSTSDLSYGAWLVGLQLDTKAK